METECIVVLIRLLSVSAACICENIILAKYKFVLVLTSSGDFSIGTDMYELHTLRVGGC